MIKITDQKLLAIADELLAGRIGILPTDTLYGLVASALNQKAVERVYDVKGRAPEKPCIILIADVSDLSHFGITLDSETSKLLNLLWPGSVSIILPLQHYDISNNVVMLSYLHRGTETLAFRLPADEPLRNLLRETGPLIAPSVNPEGTEPAISIAGARLYFMDKVDFYLDGGPIKGKPSTLVSLTEGRVRVLRQGSVIIPNELL